jgi:hypothetical protein
MGILDHLKKALLLAHAVNSPGRVKNLMSAVSIWNLIVGTRVHKALGEEDLLRIHLGEHE